MKLSCDILYWHLKEAFKSVSLHTAGSGGLNLSRPEFYLDREQNFEEGRVYVCSADHLPQRPILRKNVCLVCLGQHWNLAGFYDRCSVILIEEDTDIFRVFNRVQHIFDCFDTWEERLEDLLRHSASLPDMLEASRGIFGNPMMLLGSDFRYLAVTDEVFLQTSLGLRLDTESLDAEKLATFLSLHDLSTHVKEPLLLELQGGRTLSVNLFDQEEYLGCLTLHESFRPFREYDKTLAVFFARLLRQAIQRNPLLAGNRSALRRALRSVLSGRGIDFEYRRALSQKNQKSNWVCAKLQPQAGAAPLPGAYLAASLEERCPGAIAFELELSVAAMLPAKQDEQQTVDALVPLFQKLGLVCGASPVFSNLYEAGQAWFQASAALENGLPQAKGRTVYYFEDYLLPQLLSGALAGHPSWVFYPRGLQQLKAHDAASQVSYLDTLRVYLDNNLSVTKTAAALYLHRSTLLDRLAHITAMLGTDLKDPDYCLTLGILLRAELEQKRLEQASTQET